VSVSFFKILGPVIEREIGFITQQHGVSIKKIYARIIAEAERNQKEWYSNKVPNLNYINPICRLAYLYIVAAANAGTFKHVLEEHKGLRKFVLTKARERREIKICAFGAGPGTELLAMAKFFFELNLGMNITVDFQLVDKTQEWMSSWYGIREQVNDTFRALFSTDRSTWPIVPLGNFLSCDVTDLQSLPLLSNIWNQDIYVLNFLLSEIFDDNPHCRAFMSQVASFAPPGAHFIFIERKGTMWEKRMAAIAAESRLKLSPFVESRRTLVGERPEDLGAIFEALSEQRMPRLKWNIVYSIGVKQ